MSLAPGQPDMDGDLVVLRAGALRVEIALLPFEVTVWRGERRLVGSLGAWVAEGTVHDHFIQLTEGVVAHEALAPIERALSATVRRRAADRVSLSVGLTGGRRARLEVRIVDGRRVSLVVLPEGEPLRVALDWRRRSDERFVGLGARHGTQFDQGGRAVQLGADRRYTGPDCPAELLAGGGIPQGDYAPVPWFISSRGYGVWVRCDGNGVRFDMSGDRVSVSTRFLSGPLSVEVLCSSTPAARLRAFCRLTGFPALLPEWGYGFWKSRDVYEHQDDVVEDYEGMRKHNIPLDAIVLDSPWETQYNTWEINPYQFSDGPP